MRRFGQRPATALSPRPIEGRPKAECRAGGVRIGSARGADRLCAKTVPAPATVAGAPHSPRSHPPRSAPRQVGCCRSQSLLLLRCRNADRAVHDDDAVNWMAFVDDDAVNNRTAVEITIMEDDPVNCALVHMIGRAPRRALSQQTGQRRRRSNADLPHENLLARDWKYSRISIPIQCTILSLVGFCCGANRFFGKEDCRNGAPVGAATGTAPWQLRWVSPTLTGMRFSCGTIVFALLLLCTQANAQSAAAQQSAPAAAPAQPSPPSPEPEKLPAAKNPPTAD